MRISLCHFTLSVNTITETGGIGEAIRIYSAIDLGDYRFHVRFSLVWLSPYGGGTDRKWKALPV